MIEDENLLYLVGLQEYYSLVIVGAGSCFRISKQLRSLSVDIIGQYGLELAHHNYGQPLQYIYKNSITVDIDYFTHKIFKLRKKFNCLDYIGNSLEIHASGIVTFPILGTDAHISDKLCFDPDRAKRRLIYKDVVNSFPDHNVFIGGTSSFDIAPKEYDKYKALNRYIEERDMRPDEVVYFGDDYGVGGNDESIYLSNIDFIKVDDFKKLKHIAINNLSARAVYTKSN